MTCPKRFLTVLNLAALVGASILFAGSGDQPARADDAASADGYLAVTGLSREDTETLYLIDTRRQVMMIYETDRSRGLRLIAVRSFAHDAEMIEYHDLSERGFKASELKRRFEEQKND